MRGLIELLKAPFSLENLPTIGLLVIVVAGALIFYTSAERERCEKPAYAVEHPNCERLLKDAKG